MQQYARPDLNPPGLRVSVDGELCCENCRHALGEMASSALQCRLAPRGVPVRKDFVCDCAETQEET